MNYCLEKGHMSLTHAPVKKRILRGLSFAIVCFFFSADAPCSDSDNEEERGNFIRAAQGGKEDLFHEVSKEVNGKTCCRSVPIEMTGNDLGPKTSLLGCFTPCFSCNGCSYTPAAKYTSDGNNIDQTRTRAHRWNVYESCRHFVSPTFWTNAILGTAWIASSVYRTTQCTDEGQEQALCDLPHDMVFGIVMGAVNAYNLARYCGFHCEKRSELNAHESASAVDIV